MNVEAHRTRKGMNGPARHESSHFNLPRHDSTLHGPEPARLPTAGRGGQGRRSPKGEALSPRERRSRVLGVESTPSHPTPCSHGNVAS